MGRWDSEQREAAAIRGARGSGPGALPALGPGLSRIPLRELVCSENRAAGPPPGRPPLTRMDRVCPLSLQADGSRVQGQYGPRSTSWAGMPGMGEAPPWPFQPAAPQAPSDTGQVSRRKSQPPSWLPAPSLPTGLVIGHWPLGQLTLLLVWSRLAWGGQEGGRWCPVPRGLPSRSPALPRRGSRGRSRLLLRGWSRAHCALFLLPV